MAYTVLARRYRSQTFDEVVGQEPIARTLMNAIKSNRVAHAYLFVGTRGVGKTTMARLFAKALNGGTAEIDDLIMQGRETDTIEFDAASNTGVDEARELIANCAYKPLRGKYKIYIIDEVHMLSTSAFAWLLKTWRSRPSTSSSSCAPPTRRRCPPRSRPVPASTTSATSPRSGSPSTWRRW